MSTGLEQADAPREYLRVRWTHDLADEPVEFFFEIALPDGSVPRTVELFGDGRLVSNTVDWETAQSPQFPARSLVEGEFGPAERVRALLTDRPEFEALTCTASEFEAAFRGATPKYDQSGDQP